jgi:hypothetical protein
MKRLIARAWLGLVGVALAGCFGVAIYEGWPGTGMFIITLAVLGITVWAMEYL